MGFATFRGSLISGGGVLLLGGRYFWNPTVLKELTQTIAESDSVFTQSQETKKKIKRQPCWYTKQDKMITIPLLKVHQHGGHEVT